VQGTAAGRSHADLGHARRLRRQHPAGSPMLTTEPSMIGTRRAHVAGHRGSRRTRQHRRPVRGASAGPAQPRSAPRGAGSASITVSCASWSPETHVTVSCMTLPSPLLQFRYGADPPPRADALLAATASARQRAGCRSRGTPSRPRPGTGHPFRPGSSWSPVLNWCRTPRTACSRCQSHNSATRLSTSLFSLARSPRSSALPLKLPAADCISA